MPYPITQDRSLGAPQKRGVLGLGRRERAATDMIKPEAHEVLVYRVNGEYVEDNDALRHTHERVLDATHVSAVDLSRDTPVLVQLEIPSSEDSPFTVQVSFACTVTSAATVVREGVQNAAVLLDHYVRAHHRIFELGQDHRIDEVNEVRKAVNAQIRAYTLLSPPARNGMHVQLASVEVLTPAGKAEFEKKRREQRQASALASERADLDHSLSTEQEENTYLLRGAEQRHSNDLADVQQRHEHEYEYRQRQQDFLRDNDTQVHNHRLAARRLDFEERNLERLTAIVGDDPRAAIRQAYLAGQLSSAELATELRGYQDRDHERTRDERALEREDDLRQRQLDREERLRELEMDREDREYTRQQDRILAKAEREDRLRERQWRRELEQQQVQRDRDDQRWNQEAGLAVLKDLIARGTLDTAGIDVETLDNFVNQSLQDVRSSRISSAPPVPEVAATETAPVEELVDAEPDEEIRIEDVD